MLETHDFDLLRSTVLSNGSSAPVSVNQRHLIDKVLARYSSPGAVYRELLQNSNDAGAINGELYFTVDSLGDNYVTSVRYRNDGAVFRKEDFDRLARIAQGNPNEEKVGAFGVGFYAVFSITETPMVVSGDVAMTFHWEGDGLVATQSKVGKREKEKSAKSKWTEFVFPVREPFKMPDLKIFATFLSSSLTFTVSLMNVTVFVNDVEKIKVKKIRGDASSVKMPVSNSFFRTNLNLHSPSIFKIDKSEAGLISETPLTVIADFPSSSEVYQVQSRIISADIHASPPSKVSKEILRVMKKSPQRQFKLHLVLGDHYGEDSASVLSSFSPKPGDGRIFIGFPTRQTSGFGAHIASHQLFPAVDRDSVDLSSGHAIATWNKELLYVAGAILRIVLESSLACLSEEYLREPKPSRPPRAEEKKEEKSSVRRFFSQAAGMLGLKKDTLLHPDQDVLSDAEKRALTLLNACSAHNSSPSRAVQQAIIEGILQSMPHHELPVLTTTGFSREPLISAFGMEQFCVKTAIIKKQILEAMPLYMSMRSAPRTLTVDNLVNDLEARTIELEQAVKLIKWWPRYCNATQQFEESMRRATGQAIRHAMAVRLGERSVALSQHRFFVGPEILSYKVPLPNSCIPEDLQKSIDFESLSASFFSQLLPIRWCAWASKHPSLSLLGSPLRKKMLVAISQLYAKDTTLSSYRETIVNTLRSRQCIETQQGTLEFPTDCYLNDSSVKLFSTARMMMIASWPDSPVAIQFLRDVGVRDHVSIDVLFSSLDSLDCKEDPRLLIQYLLTIQGKLSQSEWQQLKEAKYLPSTFDDRLYAPSELVLQREYQSSLKGIKHLKWAGRRDANEEQLLRRLGVRDRARFSDIVSDGVPAGEEVLRLISSEKAYLDVVQTSQVKFIPCIQNKKSTVCSMNGCYANSRWSALGLAVVAPEARRACLALGVRQDPPVNDAVFALLSLVAKVKGEPTLNSEAKVMEEAFDAMGSLSDKLSSDKKIRTTLMNAPIVLVLQTWYRPSEVYIKKSNLFPSTKDCAFLRSLGVRDFPAPQDIAKAMLRDPQKVTSAIGEAEYLNNLRAIANDFSTFNGELQRRMKRARWLVGFRKHGLAEKRKLVRVDEVFLIDNTTLFQFECWGCPLENLLEKMYEGLGCVKLSSKVQTHRRVFGKERKTTLSESLKTRLLERRGILLDRKLRLSNGEKLLSEDMEVVEVDRVVMVLRCDGESRSSEVCCALDVSSSKLKLQVTGSIDYFEVAEALGETLFVAFKFEDRFLLGAILEMSVEQLRKRGLPVDRRIVTVPKKQMEPQVPFTPHLASQEKQSEGGKRASKMSVSSIPNGSSRPDKSPTRRPSQRLESNRTQTLNNRREEDKAGTSRQSLPSKKSKGGFLQRTLRSIAGSGTLGSAVSSNGGPSLSTGASTPQGHHQISTSTTDSEQHHRTRQTLEAAIQSCARVSSRGVKSREHMVQRAKVPNTAYSCEAIPSQDLSPLKGPHGRTKTQKVYEIRTFVARGNPEAEDRIRGMWSAVENFASVVGLLARVYGTSLSSCAIFYEPSGRTIAFNFNGSLFFNVRYFINLYGGEENALGNPDAYVYWYTTFAHELAHNLVSEHNQIHSHFTTSFIESYFVKFVRTMQLRGIPTGGGET